MQELITTESAHSLPVESTATSSPNPMGLITLAVEQGADIEKLSKLMDLQERWEANQAKKLFDEAINEFQARMPVVPKQGRVDYTTSKGRTAYDYGKIEHAFSLAAPILKDVGLSFRFNQSQEKNGPITVTCIVSHKDGHSEKNSMSAMPDTSGGKDAIKAMASTVSYLRRYTFTGGLGIIFSDEDAEAPVMQKEIPIIDAESVIIESAKKQGRSEEQLFEWLSKSFKREILCFDDMKTSEIQFIARKMEGNQ